ncbi:hypothetical protein CEXT_5981 [Caerostris extrusa]|uniref:Uncharacterized protein n=1 Tax=Caerostris extrusa TaxID=172846 RepID=A0AAV4YAC2_CAEEX|nr:hypothetical protein CEXT_5981 [Caerostris extrusa]
MWHCGKSKSVQIGGAPVSVYQRQQSPQQWYRVSRVRVIKQRITGPFPRVPGPVHRPQLIRPKLINETLQACFETYQTAQPCWKMRDYRITWKSSWRISLKQLSYTPWEQNWEMSQPFPLILVPNERTFQLTDYRFNVA